MTLLKDIENHETSICNEIASVEKRMESLLRQGVEYGSASYKENKYLRIIKPKKKGESRQFVYVGSDAEKIKGH